MQSQRLILTGASGYIGRAVCRLALSIDVEVIVLGNSQPHFSDPKVKYYSWRIGEKIPNNVIQPGDVVIHLAHDWNSDNAGFSTKNINYWGTELLAREAKNLGCSRFVFVSSTAAHENAKNTYGKIKLLTETKLLSFWDSILIARIGLVYGGPQKGLFGLLSKLTTFSPVLPLVGGKVMLQPIYLDEVARGLLAIAFLRNPDRSNYVLANPNSISFSDWLQALRRVRTGKSLFLIPIPLNVALLICDFTRLIPLLPTINRERVYGLVGAKTMSSADDLKRLNLSLINPFVGLLKGPRLGRRFLIKEANALLCYLSKPKLYSARPLVRAFEVQKFSPMYLPQLVLRWPFLMRCIEPLPRRGNSELSRRMEMALALEAVTSPANIPSNVELAWLFFIELVVLPSRLIVGYLIK